MRGAHCARHWSTTRATLALSSGEAELGGISKGLSHALGLRSIAADLGMGLSPTIRTNVTEAIGMARRLGVGKIRHLDTALRWVQGHIRSGEVRLEKVRGTENPTDALTKYMSGPDMSRHLARMNVFFEDGRASTAAQLTHAISREVSEHKKIVSLRRECPGNIAAITVASSTPDSFDQHMHSAPGKQRSPPILSMHNSNQAGKNHSGKLLNAYTACAVCCDMQCVSSSTFAVCGSEMTTVATDLPLPRAEP